MQILSDIFVGLVAIAVFVVVTRILGYLSIKFDIVNVDEDTEPMGVGCAMWVVVVVLVFICWLIGYLINNL